jgi:hypothetical protein
MAKKAPSRPTIEKTGGGRDRIARRTHAADRFRRHPEELGLRRVGVGDEAAFDHIGCTRDRRQHGSDQTAGAAFGGGEFSRLARRASSNAASSSSAWLLIRRAPRWFRP